MLRNLISGSEGVNKLWQRLVEVNNAVISNEETLASAQEAFETSIRDIMGYTDREVADIFSYINGFLNSFIKRTAANAQRNSINVKRIRTIIAF